MIWVNGNYVIICCNVFFIELIERYIFEIKLIKVFIIVLRVVKVELVWIKVKIGKIIVVDKIVFKEMIFKIVK